MPYCPRCGDFLYEGQPVCSSCGTVVFPELMQQPYKTPGQGMYDAGFNPYSQNYQQPWPQEQYGIKAGQYNTQPYLYDQQYAPEWVDDAFDYDQQFGYQGNPGFSDGRFEYDQPYGQHHDCLYDQPYGQQYDQPYGQRYDQPIDYPYDSQYDPRHNQSYSQSYDRQYDNPYIQPGMQSAGMQQAPGMQMPSRPPRQHAPNTQMPQQPGMQQNPNAQMPQQPGMQQNPGMRIPSQPTAQSQFAPYVAPQAAASQPAAPQQQAMPQNPLVQQQVPINPDNPQIQVPSAASGRTQLLLECKGTNKKTKITYIACAAVALVCTIAFFLMWGVFSNTSGAASDGAIYLNSPQLHLTDAGRIGLLIGAIIALFITAASIVLFVQSLGNYLKIFNDHVECKVSSFLTVKRDVRISEIASIDAHAEGANTRIKINQKDGKSWGLALPSEEVMQAAHILNTEIAHLAMQSM